MPAPTRSPRAKSNAPRIQDVVPDVSIEIAGRRPPQNLEAEVSVLGALLIDPEAIMKVADLLTPDDFYRPEYGTMFEAMMSLFERRVPIDIVTLSEELERSKKLEQVGGAAALSHLVSSVATATNVQYYGTIVREKAMLRRLIHAAGQIGDLGFSEELEPNDIVDKSEQTLYAVTERFLKQNFVAVRSILTESFERLDALSKQDGSVRGIPTGYRHVDSILGGLQSGDLIIIAARPSMGKTAFALNIAEYVAVREKKTVGIFSLEMAKEQLVDRLISSLGLIDSWKLRNGKLNDDDFQNLNEAYGLLSETNLFIDDGANASVTEVRAKARRLQSEHGLDLIVIDYLQLMKGSISYGADRVQEVSEISRSLKALAKEMRCPVIALSQLSRAVESRPDKRPMLSDLRESGCLTGDSLIIRSDTGERVPIKSLVGKTDIPVWSINENYQLVRQLASKVFPTGQKQIFELRLKSGRCIKATANHKFRTATGWVRFDDLNVGNRLATPRLYPGQNSKDSDHYSDDLLVLLAHMVGDGCYVVRQPIHYTSADDANIAAVEEAAAALYGITGRRVKQDSWQQLYLPAPYRLARGRKHPFVKWLESEDLSLAHSWEKHLPRSLFECSAAQIRLFLHHLWATDGCISFSADRRLVTTYYATTSSLLADQVQHLLLRLGIQSTIGRIPQLKKEKRYRDSYHVVIQGKENQSRFLRLVGCYGARGECVSDCLAVLDRTISNPNNDSIDRSVWKEMITPAKESLGITWRSFQGSIGSSYSGSAIFKSGISRDRMARVAMALKSPQLMSLAKSDVYWDEIVSITPLGIEEVYDATVPGEHNFIANDIVVHNSIEQDADIVMFLYREDYYNKEEQSNLMEVLVRKHRNGPTGDAKLLARLQFSRFETIDTQHLPQS